MSATASQSIDPLDPESTAPLYPHGPSPAALADAQQEGSEAR